LIIPFLLFPNLTLPLFLVLFFVFILPYTIDFCHILLYRTGISAGSMLAIFDTNFREALEFAQAFINCKVFLCVFFMVGLYVFMFFMIKNNKNCVCDKFRKVALLVAILFSLMTVSNIYLSLFSNRIKKIGSIQFLPLDFVHVYKDYKLIQNTLSKLKRSRKIVPFNNIISSIDKDKKETYIVVIGESANQLHQQLYGYGRDTNPYLMKIKDDLYLFDNVNTAHASTYLSLRKVLTFAYGDRIDLIFNKGSVVDYFNDAGFKTFWISNQAYSGYHDNLTTVIASNADYKKFNSDLLDNEKQIHYDEELLPYIKEALDDNFNKKIIFVHLIGSHTNYIHRVPRDRKYFKNKKFVKNDEHSKSCQKYINTYDDSIRYTDYILYQIISLLKEKNEISYLLYFSDHGEDVCDTTNDKKLGHGEDFKTKPMMNIPFILYVSDEYKNNSPALLKKIKDNLHKNYVHEDVIYTIIELSNLKNDDFKEERSILYQKE